MKVLIIGGDKRQEYMYALLCEKGIECNYVKSNEQTGILNNISDYDTVVMPVPLSRDKKTLYCTDKKLILNIDDIFKTLKKHQTVIGWNIPLQRLPSGITVRDLLYDETFVVFNAFLTAQGALCLLLENTQEYIVGKNILVTGFGRVSKTLCKILEQNGARISVSVRKQKDYITAHSLGYDVLSYDEIKSNIEKYDYVFSTVPAKVIDEVTVKAMKESVIYFELASAPYGSDELFFKKYNKKYVLASGLPGKYCAKSWAETAVKYCLNEI